MNRVFIGLTVAIAAYEVAAIRNRESGDTISERVWRASSYPLVPFLAGMIAGHFFWQRRER